MFEVRAADEPQPPPPPRGGWWSDEPELESYAHLMTMLAFITTVRRHWRHRLDFFVGGNLSVYYSARQRRPGAPRGAQSEDFLGPDLFVALGVDGERERKSWVVWEEGGKYPNVIIELLSNTTEHVDRGEKVQLYQEVFRAPEYFLFDPLSLQLDGLRLVAGRYQPIVPDAHGRLLSEQLELLLGVEGRSLRLFTRDGALVPTPDEAADAADVRVTEAEARLAKAEARVAELERELAARK
jgi:Uma2 family endonuclease